LSFSLSPFSRSLPAWWWLAFHRGKNVQNALRPSKKKLSSASTAAIDLVETCLDQTLRSRLFIVHNSCSVGSRFDGYLPLTSCLKMRVRSYAQEKEEWRVRSRGFLGPSSPLADTRRQGHEKQFPKLDSQWKRPPAILRRQAISPLPGSRAYYFSAKGSFSFFTFLWWLRLVVTEDFAEAYLLRLALEADSPKVFP